MCAAILFIAVLTSVVVGFFVTRHNAHDASIPPVLERANEPVQSVDISFEPLVIGVDTEGLVYSGRDRVGSLASVMDLKTKLKELVDARVSRLAFSRGMNINDEVPILRCTEYSVFIRSAGEAKDGRTLQLIRALREVGAHPPKVIKDQKN